MSQAGKEVLKMLSTMTVSSENADRERETTTYGGPCKRETVVYDT